MNFNKLRCINMNYQILTRTERPKDRRRRVDAVVGADVLGGANDFDGGCGGSKDVVKV